MVIFVVVVVVGGLGGYHAESFSKQQISGLTVLLNNEPGS